MNRNEVISELEYYRDSFKTFYERTDRLVKSLKATPSAQTEESLPRDAEGFAEPTHVQYDRNQLSEPPRVAHANGDTVEFDAEVLHVTDDGEKRFFKVKGGQWKKWGVFIWPEVLERDFGIDSAGIKVGLYPFKYRVRVLMDGDKPKKVVGLAG